MYKNICIPYIENNEAKIIHWTKTSGHEARETLSINGSADVLAADPLCRVQTEEGEWKDEYLSQI